MASMTLREQKDQYLSNLVRALFNSIKQYVESKGGFLDTRNEDNSKENIFADVLDVGGNGTQRVEKFVYGIKIVENKMYLATEYTTDEEGNEVHKVWDKNEFLDHKNWVELTGGYFVVLPTLLCIIDGIEQY